MKSERTIQSGKKIPPAVFLLAGIIGLVGSREAWRSFHSLKETRQLAKELSSMYVIQKIPAVSHSGKRIGLIHTTETGVGVFIQDTATKQEQKICEVLDVNYKASGAWTFGWSPNDEALAYSWDRTIHFVNPEGNEVNGRIEGITNHFQSYVWLAPDRCAYLDDLPRLALLEKVGGKWTASKFWELNTTNGNPHSLQAVSDYTVAWHTDTYLWQTDLLTGETKVVYVNKRRRMDDICYSKGAESFLVVESTNRGRACFLVHVSYTNGQALVQQLVQKPSILYPRWINDGRGYVYLSRREDDATLYGVAALSEKERLIYRAGQIMNITSDDRTTSIHMLGAKVSEPAAVWRCDISSGATESLATPHGDSNFPFRPVVYQAAPYGNKNSAKYEFVPPANFERGKKYPLVIGLGGYEWSPIAHAIYAQCIANKGAFVAFVNYRWNQRLPETIYAHTNNVLAVYHQLVKNPNIDTNRVYLFGFSAGTLVVGEVVKMRPGICRGLMLFNPSWLPEAQAGLTQRVLATAGSDENAETRFSRYQAELAKVGIPMEWHVQENTQHVPRNQTAMFDRTIWMAEMVFEK